MTSILERKYDAQVKSLEGLDATITAIRTRAIALITAAALILSFAAGLGVVNSDPSRGKVTSGWVAVGLSVSIAVLALAVLWIVVPCRWRIPQARYFGMGEPDESDADASDESLRRALNRLVDDFNHNHGKVRRRAMILVVAVVSLIAEIGIILYVSTA